LPKNVKVRSAFDADIPGVSGDASQLFQVVMNLGTNAIHAMTPGGGTLTISVEAVELGDTATKLSVDLDPGPHARLAVSDTGSGIARADMERLFEPFFTTKGVSGTGLGLSVVHGIVKEHGGAVAVESEVGTGTTVSVYLPASAAASGDAVAESQPEPPSETPSGNGEHVLYVDDDQALVNTLSRIIKRYGYRCTAYDDPDAALRAFTNSPHSFDAVLTDYMMPVMNGVTLARRLREIRPEIPIGVVSGFGVDVASAEQAGIDVRIAKPVSIEVLTQALQRMLRSRKAA
jgi:CheY-like chemotaxis protein